MFLDGLEIPGDAQKVATFHRNGGNFGPEWVATFKRNGGSFAPDYAPQVPSGQIAPNGPLDTTTASMLRLSTSIAGIFSHSP